MRQFQGNPYINPEGSTRQIYIIYNVAGIKPSNAASRGKGAGSICVKYNI